MADQNPNTVGKLVSRLDHSVTIAYNGKGIMVPARGTVKKVTRVLLGAIPKGIQFIPTHTKQ